MAQATAITINDGAATPVAVTFNPEQVTPALSVFADRSSGTSNSYRRIRVESKFAKGASTVNRAKFEVEYPITSIVNGITTTAYVLRAKVDVILPEACTDAERKNLYAFVRNGLAHALIQGAMRDLDALY